MVYTELQLAKREDIIWFYGNLVVIYSRECFDFMWNIFETCILFWVRVPVLSKHIVCSLEPSTVFYASVPVMPYLRSLRRQKL